MGTLYLCGAGNGEGVRLAVTVERAAHRWDRIVLLDDDPARHGSVRAGVTVIGGFELLAEADPASDRVVNLVTRTTAGRARARTRIAGFGVPFASLVHPSVELFDTSLDLSPDDIDAQEVTIYPRAWVGAGCSVGPGTVALVGAVIGHGASVGAGCVIAPNAVVNARVELGDRVYIGANATILPDVRIGADATIAGNTLVIDDVPGGATALGVPAVVSRTASPSSDDEEGAMPEPVSAADVQQLVARIAAVTGELLAVDAVAPGANFFDLGGTSRQALHLAQHLHDRLGLPTHPMDVFAHPSVRSLADHYAALATRADRASTSDRSGVSHGSSLQDARARGAMRRVPARA